jgi:hypothetical protein
MDETSAGGEKRGSKERISRTPTPTPTPRSRREGATTRRRKQDYKKVIVARRTTFSHTGHPGH